MIIITKTFQKELTKLGSVSILDIQREIKKYSIGLQNLIELGELDERKILKGYLNSKKVRVIISFTEYNGNYFPFYIVRKETKGGYNISKSSLHFLQNQMQKHTKDFLNGDFEKIEI